jgi:hypothetical protein
VVDAYRRIRNTLRFLLANTSDFDPGSDAVPLGELLEIDRYALARAAQLQAEPYNLPAPLATGVAQAIAGGLTLTAAEQEKIAYTWVSMSIVERNYPLVAQLSLVLGIPDAIMDQLFLTRGESTNG